jgi:hypothetical protein
MLKDAQDFNSTFVAKMHNDLKIDDENFTMRYKIFVLRLESQSICLKFSYRIYLC